MSNTLLNNRIPIFISICRAVANCNLHLFGHDPKSLHDELVQVIRESEHTEFEFELKRLYSQMYNRTWEEAQYEMNHPCIVYAKTLGQATLDWEATHLSRRRDSIVVVRFPFQAIGYFHPQDLSTINPKWTCIVTEYGAGWIVDQKQPRMIQLSWGTLYRGEQQQYDSSLDHLSNSNDAAGWCRWM